MTISAPNFFWLLLPLISGCGATETPDDRVQEDVVGSQPKQLQDASISTTAATNETTAGKGTATGDQARFD